MSMLPGLGSITAIGGKWDSQEAFFGFQSFTVPPSVYMIDFKAEQRYRALGAGGRAGD